MPARTSVKGEYIETETGNKISRRSQILGARHIVLAGKCVIQSDVIIHGDLVRPAQSKTATPQTAPPAGGAGEQKSDKPSEPNSVHLGRYVFISPGCTIHPPSRVNRSATNAGKAGAAATPTEELSYYPIRISDYVFIGPNTHVRAAEIRSNVSIGANCVVGNMCVIKDNVRVLDGSVLPANSVWASGSIVAGRPARVVGELGEAWGSGSGVDDIVGVRSRERWAAVGNNKR